MVTSPKTSCSPSRAPWLLFSKLVALVDKRWFEGTGRRPPSTLSVQVYLWVTVRNGVRVRSIWYTKLRELSQKGAKMLTYFSLGLFVYITSQRWFTFSWRSRLSELSPKWVWNTFTEQLVIEGTCTDIWTILLAN